VVVVVLGLLPGWPAVAQDPDSGTRRSSYDMQATYEAAVHLDWDTRRVRVDVTIGLRNTSGGPVGRLELNSLAARLGSIRLTAASIDGTPVEIRVRGQTIILVLPSPLAEEAEAVVRVAFRARLLTTTYGRDHLWTRSGGVARMYRFIPWLSRAIAFGPTMNGDPFLTPTSPAVRVTLSADRPLVWATTGRRVAPVAGRQTFSGTDVREFSLTASPAYRVRRGRSRDGRTRILVYTQRESADLWLRLARRELARFGRRFGPYPWPTFRIAETDSPTAMEAPGLIWLPRGRSASNYAYVMAHEVAHQWFYALVGNDQARDPFADEGLVDFLARHALGQLRRSRCPTDRLDRGIHDYSSTCYYETVYIQGARFLDGLRRDFGARPFWRALRRYGQENRFVVASNRRLLETLREELGDRVLRRYRARFPSLYP
jgi:hypothetical protein